MVKIDQIEETGQLKFDIPKQYSYNCKKQRLCT